MSRTNNELDDTLVRKARKLTRLTDLRLYPLPRTAS